MITSTSTKDEVLAHLDTLDLHTEQRFALGVLVDRGFDLSTILQPGKDFILRMAGREAHLVINTDHGRYRHSKPTPRPESVNARLAQVLSRHDRLAQGFQAVNDESLSMMVSPPSLPSTLKITVPSEERLQNVDPSYPPSDIVSSIAQSIVLMATKVSGPSSASPSPPSLFDQDSRAADQMFPAQPTAEEAPIRKNEAVGKVRHSSPLVRGAVARALAIDPEILMRTTRPKVQELMTDSMNVAQEFSFDQHLEEPKPSVDDVRVSQGLLFSPIFLSSKASIPFEEGPLQRYLSHDFNGLATEGPNWLMFVNSPGSGVAVVDALPVSITSHPDWKSLGEVASGMGERIGLFFTFARDATYGMLHEMNDWLDLVDRKLKYYRDEYPERVRNAGNGAIARKKFREALPGTNFPLISPGADFCYRWWRSRWVSVACVWMFGKRLSSMISRVASTTGLQSSSIVTRTFLSKVSGGCAGR